MNDRPNLYSDGRYILSCLALALLGLALIGTSIDLGFLTLEKSPILGGILIAVAGLLGAARLSRRRLS